MARHRGRTKKGSSLSVLLDFIDVVDAGFTKLTGRPVASWFKEFQEQLRELPPGEELSPSQPTMPLADACAIFGLPQTASLKEFDKRYRDLALLFHPDRPGGYEGAMKLLNRANEVIQQHRGGSH